MSSFDPPFKYLVKMFETGDVQKLPNDSSVADISLHERIFKQLNELYNHPKNGLIAIGEKVGLEILPPKKKVTVLLIGNHSAGKSSFINWYIEDNVQRTGMAIETQSFTLITSGRKRETLMGPATIFLFPDLKPLEHIEGTLDYLMTEISTSKKRQFPMVTFIDSPGMVDGGMEYPYDVNDTILFLGGVADLIFVFFDPIGLALCKRTMIVVEKINSLYPEKLHMYLSKSDEIRKQTDKQKIMMQITQEVCRHSGLNRSGFSMPGIYIPTLAHKQELQKQHSNMSISSEDTGTCQMSECHNEIEEVCKQIDQTISRMLQTALNSFEKDINTLLHLINGRLTSNHEAKQQNKVYFLFSMIAVFIFMGLLFTTSVKYLTEIYSPEHLSRIFHLHQDYFEYLSIFGNFLPPSLLTAYGGTFHQVLIVLSFFVVLFIYCKTCFKMTLPRREVKELERLRVFVSSYLKKKKVELTQEYLRDSCDL
ncbi:uncharacterized protein LOC128999120 [Macrosteles quadrilineatus]|uniref:uncharacterized protein LOC128999120 n=1 Tax=Macrosteles quadrilineatus TaxID=74068 RepID=UPI0023E276C8|nr:uncharacterized protein LOC128999120 [Macrosteles quadrilineatus]